MNYVCGFLFSWDLQEFLLIRKNHPEWQKGKWNGIGGKIQAIDSTVGGDGRTYEFPETPHEAMIREFYEETGIQTNKKRWHCFHIEEYKTGSDEDNYTKIYFFAAFGDETKRKFLGDIEGQGEIVETHTLIDMFWDQKKYIYNLYYLIHMVIYQVKKGFFYKLNPQGINS